MANKKKCSKCGGKLTNDGDRICNECSVKSLSKSLLIGMREESARLRSVKPVTSSKPYAN